MIPLPSLSTLFQTILTMLLPKSLLLPFLAVPVAQSYILGLGIGDITGPVVETNMMGYASLAQTDSGLHMRQFARAFIVSSATSVSGMTTDNTVVMVNADIAMGDNGVRRSILAQLAADATLSTLYTTQNFALFGTHQHSGVGGYLENLLPQLTSLGFVNQTAQAIVTGTMSAIRAAHSSLASGNLSFGNTTLLNTNANRSPSAYLNNPASERAQFQFDQDKDFSLIKFDTRGFLSFFPVHGTSIYENNTLVSSDNKGYAAFLSEMKASPNAQPGKGSFVAGFVQANVGDTSPNILGAFCESPGQPFDGQPCDFNTSTCGGTAEQCHGRGPAFNQDSSGMASNAIIGTNQFNAAQSVLGSSLASLSGVVKSAHVFVNMSQYTFTLANGSQTTTCPPAMGFSFAGGTTDGPGAFDFTQGDNGNGTSQNPFWDIVKSAVTPPPNQQQVACHAPKPILLNTGYAHTPYEWQPSTVNIQLIRIGQVVIVVFPGELTTMAGRRLKATVQSAILSSSILPSGVQPIVLIAGPSNTYSHYVTTFEEYQVQRYEGASTIYGPHTLEAYQDIFTKMVPAMADSGGVVGVRDDPAPVDQSSQFISLQTPVVFDAPPFLQSFGKVVTDVITSTPYKAGQTVNATFVGANPRNNLRLGGTFLTVDRNTGGSTFTTVKTDAWPSTTYQWLRTNTVLGTSTVTISWTIESGTPAGTYRLTYNGDAKALIGGGISSFTGTSSSFTVSA